MEIGWGMSKMIDKSTVKNMKDMKDIAKEHAILSARVKKLEDNMDSVQQELEGIDMQYSHIRLGMGELRFVPEYIIAFFTDLRELSKDRAYVQGRYLGNATLRDEVSKRLDQVEQDYLSRLVVSCSGVDESEYEAVGNEVLLRSLQVIGLSNGVRRINYLLEGANPRDLIQQGIVGLVNAHSETLSEERGSNYYDFNQITGVPIKRIDRS